MAFKRVIRAPKKVDAQLVIKKRGKAKRAAHSRRAASRRTRRRR